MKKFDRYIYLGDIHSRREFIDFVQEQDDNKTFFILAWDLFDRGSYSLDVFFTIERLYLEGKLQIVLWNHDLFFIWYMNKNYHQTKLFEINSSNLYSDIHYNINYQYDKAKMLYCSPLDTWYTEGQELFLSYERENSDFSPKEKTMSFLTYMAKFLSQFNLYYIDDLKNLTVHWWIPFFTNWLPVWHHNKNNEWVAWLDFVKDLDILLKENKAEWLTFLSWSLDSDTLVNENKEYYQDLTLKGPIDSYKWLYWFVPTWYLNREYETNEDVYLGLIRELEKNNLNHFFCGHDYSSNFDSYNNLTRVYRLDLWIWYVIMNQDNKLITKWKI